MAKVLVNIFYIIGIYLFIVFLLYIFQRSLLYLPSNEKIDVTYYSMTELKPVYLKTSDGLILKSLFQKPKTSKNQTILVFHGNAGHIGHRVKKFKPFLDAGFGLLLLEYRGYSDNPGKPSEKGLQEDSIAAINFLSKHYIPLNKIILYGESLGCGLATKLSTKEQFHSTILEAPYTSISDVAQHHYWLLPAKWMVLDQFDIIGIINKIKSPLLVVHGEKDNIISVAFGKRVFDTAPYPKKAIFIANAGHNNLYEFNLYEKIFNFIKNIT